MPNDQLQVLATGESSKSHEDGTIEVALKVAVSGRDDSLALSALSGKQVTVIRQGGGIVDRRKPMT